MDPQGPPKTLDDPRTQAILAAAIEAQRELGTGFLERVYQNALGMELESQGIPAAAVEAPFHVPWVP